MSEFKEAFDAITKSRHYETVESSEPARPASAPPARSLAVSAASAAIVMKNPGAILASPRQKMNPIIKYVRSVPIEFSADSNMLADFAVSSTCVFLYLSIKYHKLNPEYLIGRMEAVKRFYRLRIVLIQIDDVDCELALLRIQTLCVSNGFTAICAFTEEEAARYLEIYKKNEKKSSDEIEEKKNIDFLGRATDTLTQVRGVNKSDVKNLLRNFASIADILQAPIEDLALCAGIGERKIARMYSAFNEPFFASQQKTETTYVEKDANVDIVAVEQMEDDDEGADDTEIYT